MSQLSLSVEFLDIRLSDVEGLITLEALPTKFDFRIVDALLSLE